MTLNLNSNLKHQWFVENFATKPLVLLLIAFLIPLIGLVLSVTYFNTAFNRSGAVLVCFAIFSVYINHFVKSELEITKSMAQAITKLGENAADIENNMNPEIKDLELRKNTAVSMSELLKKAHEEIPKLNEINKNIVVVEFLSGSIGTLIWGFGDIPFTISKSCA